MYVDTLVCNLDVTVPSTTSYVKYYRRLWLICVFVAYHGRSLEGEYVGFISWPALSATNWILALSRMLGSCGGAGREREGGRVCVREK
jgi:hypothetical protein